MIAPNENLSLKAPQKADYKETSVKYALKKSIDSQEHCRRKELAVKPNFRRV